MPLIVGSGDDTGKVRRYKTGFLEPDASFLHMSVSTGSSLVRAFCNRNRKTIKFSSLDMCVFECGFVFYPAAFRISFAVNNFFMSMSY